MMDQYHPLAKSFNIRHVMAGEQNGSLVTLIVFEDKGAQAVLDGYIQTQGGLI